MNHVQKLGIMRSQLVDPADECPDKRFPTLSQCCVMMGLGH
jgi:hypothetical protein